MPSAAVIAVTDVQWLMEVADNVQRKSQSQLLVFAACAGIVQRLCKSCERGNRIALSRRADIRVAPAHGHGDMMPRVCGRLPERLWV